MDPTAELTLRLGFFGGVLGAMMLWEWVAPRRPLSLSRAVRWTQNLALVALNSLVVRLLFPAAAVGLAALASDRGWGLLNGAALPPAVSIPVSVLALDLVIYLQHVMFHAVPVLWRVHRVHHADVDFDVTTGLRFHPIEIVLSMLVKFAAILVLGPPAIAVLVFEVILNATAMFNHGNVRIPGGIDRWLRWFVVTPDMHRVHHSIEDHEANSNFGFSSPWWDRLLGTYRGQPKAGHEGMTIGLRTYREPRQVAWLAGMLAFPFAGQVAGTAINRRRSQEHDPNGGKHG
ncbi:MAG: sterol desaturase family protein [Planctomycetota bacterium]